MTNQSSLLSFSGSLVETLAHQNLQVLALPWPVPRTNREARAETSEAGLKANSFEIAKDV